jgi:hypothetical protein
MTKRRVPRPVRVVNVVQDGGRRGIPWRRGVEIAIAILALGAIGGVVLYAESQYQKRAEAKEAIAAVQAAAFEKIAEVDLKYLTIREDYLSRRIAELKIDGEKKGGFTKFETEELARLERELGRIQEQIRGALQKKQ